LEQKSTQLNKTTVTNQKSVYLIFNAQTNIFNMLIFMQF
jgi:hypothetical protein